MTHGDYRLQNIMLLPDGAIGYLELGRISTGDRYVDLASRAVQPTGSTAIACSRVL